MLSAKLFRPSRRRLHTAIIKKRYVQDRHFGMPGMPIDANDPLLTVTEKPQCVAFADVHTFGASDNVPLEVAEDWVNQIYLSESAASLSSNLTEPLPIFAGLMLQTLLRNAPVYQSTNRSIILERCRKWWDKVRSGWWKKKEPPPSNPLGPKPKQWNPAQLSIALMQQLGQEGIRSAIGGALAQNKWGEVRVTLDIDLNVGLETLTEAHARDKLLSVLAEFGAWSYDPDTEGFTKTLNRSVSEEQLRLHNFLIVGIPSTGSDGKVYPIKVELFPPKLPLQRLLFEDSRAIRSFPGPDGQPISYLSPEAVIVFKLLFYRGKDRTDIAGILRKMKRTGTTLDADLLNKMLELVLQHEVGSIDHGLPDSAADRVDWFRYLQSIYRDSQIQPTPGIKEKLKASALLKDTDTTGDNK